jgi:hypothetical protein
VEPSYIRDEILTPFFRAFWNHRMAMDRRNYKQLVDTTVEIAQKVFTIVVKDIRKGAAFIMFYSINEFKRSALSRLSVGLLMI